MTLVSRSRYRIISPPGEGRTRCAVVSLSLLFCFFRFHAAPQVGDREYRPVVNMPNCNVDCKLLKPQNCLEMLAHGTRDLAFGGQDWVSNLGIEANVVEVLDTELDPVRIIAASPNANILAEAKATGKHLVIASEYEKLTRDWIAREGLNASFVRAFGATESFPPDDADIIVDNTATGSTLKANGLHIIATLFHSSTRIYANKLTLEDASKKRVVDELVLLLKSVLVGRNHMLIEFNLEKEKLAAALPHLPCMRAPTISPLGISGDQGYAVRLAVKKSAIAALLPQLKTLGATDIIVSALQQIVA